MAEYYTGQRSEPWSDEYGASEESGGPVSRCVRQWPEESVLVALASGVAVGVGIGIALGGSSRPSGWRDRRIAEGMGERVLASLDRVLPESLSRTLGLNR